MKTRSHTQLDREIADALTSKEISVKKLFAWQPKLTESLVDVAEGRLSHASGKPLRVSSLDTPRGAYMILDGHHRAIEAIQVGRPTIRIAVDFYVPRVERAGGAYRSYVEDKVNVFDFIHRRRK